MAQLAGDSIPAYPGQFSEASPQVTQLAAPVPTVMKGPYEIPTFVPAQPQIAPTPYPPVQPPYPGPIPNAPPTAGQPFIGPDGRTYMPIPQAPGQYQTGAGQPTVIYLQDQAPVLIASNLTAMWIMFGFGCFIPLVMWILCCLLSPYKGRTAYSAVRTASRVVGTIYGVFFLVLIIIMFSGVFFITANVD